MDNIYRLFEKYRNNQCSPEEIEELLAYFRLEQHDTLLRSHIDLALKQQHLNEDDDADLQHDADEVYANIRAQIITQSASLHKTSWGKWLAAASVLVCFLAAAYFFIHRQQPAQQVAQVKNTDLLPGTDKATLIVAGGRRIDVGGAQQGTIATEGNTAVKKTADGRIIYEAANKNPTGNGVVENTMVTPRGGQHLLVLADGTKAWLDAQSSITFPVVFNGDERKVSITGQVYFEVAHDARKPFRVSAGGQTIEVLGTHFNVNAYADEPSIRTTLLQGSVKVSKNGASKLLSPGQQSAVGFDGDARIDVKTVDSDEAIAWHNGLFKFQNANIQTVMRQLARWYDVDISYEGEIADRRFSGEIYRNVNASKIAEILSYKQIHFRIEGKRIIVMP